MNEKSIYLNFLLFVSLLINPLTGFGTTRATMERWELLESGAVIVSVEHYQQRDGWTPVLMTIGELEINFWIDGSGAAVMEPGLGEKYEQALFWLDVDGGTMTLDKELLMLKRYEKNDVRSRFRVQAAELKLGLQIDLEQGRCDLVAGTVLLSRGHLRAEKENAMPGEKVYSLMGPEMRLERPLVFRQGSGEMVIMPLAEKSRFSKKPRLWARKSSR
jgi:hypothetical protein